MTAGGIVSTTVEGIVPTTVYVDGDGCPMKDEVYRVAGRYGGPTIVVANTWLRGPPSPLIALVVDEGLDRADDLIAAPGDVVINADIPLADRCVNAGARAPRPMATRRYPTPSAARWPSAI